MLYPLTFHPIFKERVWGDRNLERLYQKALPPGIPIGESWELTDRPEGASVIANGPHAGKDLRWLMQNHSADLLGFPTTERFPLLLKILDADQKLSLQVHPPADKAAALGGEPKSEMWYISDAAPGAELFVGLKRGVTREEFERKIKNGGVADCFHRIPVAAGDSMFLPSGRVHAIGAGLVIFEIQQNSDTTYRVCDWDRLGLDGKPRDLHIQESLASIDFKDIEPAVLHPRLTGAGPVETQQLVRDRSFTVEVCRARVGAPVGLPAQRMQILATVSGAVTVCGAGERIRLGPGRFGLIPASLPDAAVGIESDATFLRIEAGEI
jgi:mannose-6-phosphate isomerase